MFEEITEILVICKFSYNSVNSAKQHFCIIVFSKASSNTVKSEENITLINEKQIYRKSSVFLPFFLLFVLFGHILRRQKSFRLISTAFSKISSISSHQIDSLLKRIESFTKIKKGEKLLISKVKIVALHNVSFSDMKRKKVWNGSKFIFSIEKSIEK
jgi:hypothetical protein